MKMRALGFGVGAALLLLAATTTRAELGQPPDEALRMPFYTARILPTPQKAVYRDQFASLENVGLILGPTSNRMIRALRC